MTNSHSKIQPIGADSDNKVIYNGQSRLIKYYGIREPKGRVKGFRVEIRPSHSSTKIWVGTFETRVKAMRAYDAAVYLTGKEPYYFEYPEEYFPERPSRDKAHLLRKIVQSEAKKFAEKTEELVVNPVSLILDPMDSMHPHNSKCTPTMTGQVAAKEEKKMTRTDVKVVEAPDTLWPDPSLCMDEGTHIAAADLREFYELFPSLPDSPIEGYKGDHPFCSAPAASPPHLADPLFCSAPVTSPQHLYDLEVDDGKVLTEESAAYLRGLNAPNTSLDMGWLDSTSLPEIFPDIEGEAFFPLFHYPSMHSSKRKFDDYNCTIGGPSDDYNCTIGGSSETYDTADGWISTYIFGSGAGQSNHYSFWSMISPQ